MTAIVWAQREKRMKLRLKAGQQYALTSLARAEFDKAMSEI